MGLTEILHNLLHATYGRDVRQSLHDGVKMAVETADETKKAQVELEGKFEAQIKNMTLESPSDAEIVAARTDANGKAYDTLGKRLDASEKAYDALGKRLDTSSTTANEAQALLMSGVARVTTFNGKLEKGTSNQFLVDVQKSMDVEVRGQTYKYVPIGVVGRREYSNTAANCTHAVAGTFLTYQLDALGKLDRAYVIVDLHETPNMDVTVELDVLYVLSVQDMNQLLV